jgi:hypothetical protein
MRLVTYANIPPYIVFLDSKPAYLAERSFIQIDIKRNRKGDKPASLVITTEWMPASNKRQPLTYSISSFGGLTDPLEGDPLNIRAWTLQGRILAPPYSAYGSEQMFWECKKCLLAEGGSHFTSQKI